MIVHSQVPFNAEPPLARLRAAAITAQVDFYVRCHGAIPHLPEEAHRLRVTGRVATPLDLSLAELRQRFPARSVTAVMQCAGNRRADLQVVRPTSGDPWAPGAIGNATWSGVALADVLRAAGADPGAALHVAFEACDEVETPSEGRFSYGASIPMAKALAPEVLLATGMNGEPLTPEHGFPLRAVVPGYAGVRSPKWLTGITVQDRPSDNPMQARDYKLLPPDVTAETVDWAQGITIDEMPLNAAICDPAPHATLPAGPLTLRGYAIATARAVTRVDVSADGGRTWRQAHTAARCDGAMELDVLAGDARAGQGCARAGGARLGFRRANAAGACGRHLELQGLPERGLASGFPSWRPELDRSHPGPARRRRVLARHRADGGGCRARRRGADRAAGTRPSTPPGPATGSTCCRRRKRAAPWWHVAALGGAGLLTGAGQFAAGAADPAPTASTSPPPSGFHDGRLPDAGARWAAPCCRCCWSAWASRWAARAHRSRPGP